MIISKITALNKAAFDSLKDDKEQQIVKRFTDVAIEILDADFGFVWMKNRNSKKFELAYTSSRIPFTPVSPRKTGITHRVLHNKIPLLIKRISKTGSVRSDAKKNLEGLATIPITYKNYTYGNMYICFKEPWEFSQEDQALCGLIGNSTAQALTINRLHHNLQEIKHTLDHTPQPKLIFDPVTRAISYYNKSLLDQSSLNKKQLAQAKFQDIIHPSAYKITEKRLKHIVTEKVPSSVFETILLGPKNRKLPVEILLQYVSQPGQPPHLLAILQDLKERKKNEEQIKHAAFHDTLTGLPNRFLFTQRLNDLLRISGQKNRSFGVIFIDLDRFKFINDTIGHLMGDALLKQVAQRLKSNVKRSDMVSRFGGDEFVILLPNIRSAKQAERVAKRIQKSFETPFQLSTEQEVYINFSMGITIFPKNGTDTETLLKNADNALYRAKQLGGNSYLQFDSDMITLKPSHLQIEKDLRNAIAKKQLRLHYQPIINLKTGQIVKVEALVRWQHPTMGLLTPQEFIPYAEESGLIVPLGEWVFAEVCRQQNIWRKLGFHLPVGINVSTRELLQKNMIRQMQKFLKHSQLSPKNIILEITETFLIQNTEASIGMLNQVRKMGFRTSLDDFGSGYASLNYLKRFSIDFIKIGQLFINDCTTNQYDAGIIEAIITVAHRLHIQVIAEGVEQQAQIEFLKSLNCDMVQGHYYYQSMPANEIKKLLSRQPAQPTLPSLKT